MARQHKDGGLRLLAVTICAVTLALTGVAPARAGTGAEPLTPDDLTVPSFLDPPVRVGDALYYRAQGAGRPSGEVWRTTDAGTTEQVTDIDPPRGSHPVSLTAAGDLLLYAASDATTGFELWQTDTTTGETTRLTDLDDITPTDGGTHGPPDEVDGSTSPTELTVVGDSLFFQGDDGRSGRELWETDLATGETTQAADLVPGGAYSDSSPHALTVVGDDLLLVATTPDGHDQLWRHDTGTGRTTQLTDVDRYVSGYYDQGHEAGRLLVADGSVFFSARDKAHGTEPWRADLATGQARLVDDVHPGPKGSAPDEGTLVGHRLFFSAQDGATGRELWQTDTRTGETRRRADIDPGGRGSGSYPQELTAVGSRLYFSARDTARGENTGQELWRTVPGRRGAALVDDIRPGRAWADPVFLVAVGDRLYFRAYDEPGSQGRLWTAVAGRARPVTDAPRGSSSEPLLDDDGRLVFAAQRRLWVA